MRKSLASLLILLFLTTLVTFHPATVVSQTYNEVNGIISSNITLTKANGPYHFAQVVVNSGATLTIEAGSTVSIGGYLQVDGTLIAKGTNNNSIYFSGGPITFTSTSTANSLIEYANLFWVQVAISGRVTIENSFLQAGQAVTTLSISGGSPIISFNTLKGTLDSVSVVIISGGSPTISNNNIIAFVDNGLYPNPPAGMNRFGSAYGVHAYNVSGAIITNNKFYQPFRSSSVQVDSGTATVEGNTEYLNESIAYPTPTPPPPTPTPIPTPTLPPYPPQTTLTPTANPTSTPTIPEVSSTIILALFLTATLLTLLVQLKKGIHSF
jgi:hypothetical protein